MVVLGLRKRRRGSQVIVIHPGSRYIRIGRASDVNPITIPCVVARKSNIPLKPTKRVRLVSYPRNQQIESVAVDLSQEGTSKQAPPDPVRVEYSSESKLSLFIFTVSLAQFETKLSSITVSLRDRMRFYKLRVTPNATKIASTFNEQFKPEKIAEHNDYQTEWIDGSCGDEVLIGEKVRRFYIKNSYGLLYYHAGLASRGPRYLELPGEMAYLRL